MMSRDSLSAEFDLLFNNVSSDKAPGLSEFEKSQYLTDALHLVVKDAYSGNSGPFEATEEVTEYIQSLVKQVDYINTDSNDSEGLVYLSSNTPKALLVKQYDKLFGDMYKEYKTNSLPEELWFIVFEKAMIGGGETCAGLQHAAVLPTTHNELYKKLQNPFRNPNARTVLRTMLDSTIELFSAKPLSVYSVRYLKDPGKIHLCSFNVTGEGGAEAAPKDWEFDVTQEETNPDALNVIPESLIRVILYKAVELAKATWQ